MSSHGGSDESADGKLQRGSFDPHISSVGQSICYEQKDQTATQLHARLTDLFPGLPG